MLGDAQRAWAARADPRHDAGPGACWSRPWCSTAWSCRSSTAPSWASSHPRGYAVVGGKAMCTDEWDGYPAERQRLVEAIAGDAAPGCRGPCRATSTRPGPSRGRAPAATATGRPRGRGVRRPLRHRHPHGPPAPSRVAEAARQGGREAARGPVVRAREPRLHGRSRSTRCRCGTTGTPSTPKTPGPRCSTAPRGPTAGSARGASSRSRWVTTPRRRSALAPAPWSTGPQVVVPARPSPVLDREVPRRRRRRAAAGVVVSVAAAAGMAAAIRHHRRT